MIDYDSIVRAARMKTTGANVHDVNNELCCLLSAIELDQNHLVRRHHTILMVWLSGRCKTIKDSRRWYTEHVRAEPIQPVTE